MQQYMHVHISEKGLLINVAIIHQTYNILFSLKSTVMNAHIFTVGQKEPQFSYSVLSHNKYFSNLKCMVE